MKKILKSILSASLMLITFINSAAPAVSADFSDHGKHWYYSDDQSFKYWGLTEVNDYGLPVNEDDLGNITFNGIPESFYKKGVIDYTVVASVYTVPTPMNVKITLRGDADYDSDTDLYDAIFIAGTFIGTSAFEDDFHEFTCDYNLDGEISLYDVIELCRIIMQDSISVQITEEKIRAEYVKEVVRLVNIERAKYGLSELALDQRLCEAAQVRAIECSKIDDVDHTRPDGRSCFTVLQEMNISYYYTGENLAAGYQSPAAVVKGWMDSEGHKENILDPNYTKVGIGYCSEPDTYYQYFWSQFFIQD